MRVYQNPHPANRRVHSTLLEEVIDGAVAVANTVVGARDYGIVDVIFGGSGSVVERQSLRQSRSKRTGRRAVSLPGRLAGGHPSHADDEHPQRRRTRHQQR